MNVIGHMVCAEHLGPDGSLGAMLPDLLSLYDRRIRPLKLIHSADDQTAEREGWGALRDGMRFHFHVDSAFHRSTLFRESAEAIRHRLLAASGAPGLKRFAVAHVLTELFFDHLLIVQNPLRLEEFYGVLARVRLDSLHAGLALLEGADRDGFSAFLHRLVEVQFAHGYVERENLLDRADRILTRLRQRRLDPDERAAALGGFSEDAERAQAQLDEFVAAMRLWRGCAASEADVDSGVLAGIE